jgi:radical SAM superfamily enzyme YgiQ (UPF0313 family)
LIKNHRKILLIEPPFYRLYKNSYSLNRYPLSLGYLAASIKKFTQWDITVFNADFNPENEFIKTTFLAGQGFNNYLENLRDISAPIWQEIFSNIEEENPDVIGISVKSQNLASSLIIAKLIKNYDANIKIIFGGPHPSMVGKELLLHKEIDFVVIGEGEITIVELLNAFEGDCEYEQINGIAYKKNGVVIQTPPRTYISNLDILPFPIMYATEVLKYYEQYPPDSFKYIFASRGCPYDCFFCGSDKIWSHKVRHRTVQNVIEEIKYLQNIGITTIHFDDDIWGIKKSYIYEFCDELKDKCMGIKWSCELHVNIVDEDIIKKMKSAGCYSIQIGVESGNNEILKKNKKNITLEKAFEAARLIKKNKIDLVAFFIVGFPDESADSLNDTIQAMKKIKCDQIAYSIFTPYPGTEAFIYCKSLGIVNDSFDVSLYNHQSPLNYFSKNIQPEYFRKILSKTEKMVDRKVLMYRIRQIFSAGILNKIKMFGIIYSLKRAVRIFTGK